MKPKGWVALSQHLYRWLLQLYPRGYRTSYEEEMFHLFTDQCREAYKTSGALGILSLWSRTLADVGTTVLREHLNDPSTRSWLLEAEPNAPLPWKGVLLVLIPGLIFFVSQVLQVLFTRESFFLISARAGYILILPVLFVCLSTRSFPVWGLIPLGLLYITFWDYLGRFDLGRLPFLGHWFAKPIVTVWGVTTWSISLNYLFVILLCVISLVALIRHHARRGQISPTAWKWLALYILLIVVQIIGAVYRATAAYQAMIAGGTVFFERSPQSYFFDLVVRYLYDLLPLLLLIFIGMFFARKYGGLSFLLLLGYLLPAVLYGGYNAWLETVPFYVIVLAVLVYRFIVALVAPVWLVRAASIPGRQRAAVIPVVLAILCRFSLNFILLTWQSDFQIHPSNLTFTLVNQLIVATALGLAITLYLPRRKNEDSSSPPDLVTAVEQM